MGVTLTQNYEESVLERDFYGVYCGQSALPLAPESIHYLINDAIRGLHGCMITRTTEPERCTTWSVPWERTPMKSSSPVLCL